MKYYIDYVTLTSGQYPHCTLEEKLTVYVQHRPACVVPFLKELIERVTEVERKNREFEDEAQRLKDFQEAVDKDD